MVDISLSLRQLFAVANLLMRRKKVNQQGSLLKARLAISIHCYFSHEIKGAIRDSGKKRTAEGRGFSITI